MKLVELQAPEELQKLEQMLDYMFRSLGLNVEFSRHFAERLLGREKSVTIQEIVVAFDQLRKKYKNRLLSAKKKGHYEAVLKDFGADLNIVFGINGNELSGITIMRKNPNQFHTNTNGGDELKVGNKK